MFSVSVTEKLIPKQKLSLGLNREALQALCNLSSTEADRKLIMVATTASMSASHSIYGISNLHKEREKAQAIKEYAAIKSVVDELVRAKEKAVLGSFGVTEASNSEKEMVTVILMMRSMTIKRKLLVQNEVKLKE